VKEKSSSQAKCSIDGRWHQPKINYENGGPNTALFPHCIPKECAMPVPTQIENGKVTCNLEMGKFAENGDFTGQVGATCKIDCDPNYTLGYSSDATSWDKQKKLFGEIECLFSQ